MTNQTHKIRLTLSKNADTELFLAIDKLDSRRRSYRLIELAKLGLRVEGRLHGTLDGLMETNGPEKEIVKPCPQPDKPTIPQLKIALLQEYFDLINDNAGLLVKKEHELRIKEHELRIAADELARTAAQERDDAANQFAELQAKFDRRLHRAEIVAMKRIQRQMRRDAKNAAESVQIV
jgi:hypothetical protein